MTTRYIRDPRGVLETLQSALRMHVPVSVAIAGQPVNGFKARFLEIDPDGQFLVIDYLPTDGKPLPLLTVGRCISLSFRMKNRRLLLSTIVDARGHFRDADDELITAVRCMFPKEVAELQRRCYQRTAVPAGVALAMHLMRKNEDGTFVGPEEPLRTHVADISCGGALVRVLAGDERATEGAHFAAKLFLSDGKPPVTLEATCRRRSNLDDGEVVMALQFQDLLASPDGSRTLERVASCVQRFHRVASLSGSRM